MYTITEQRVFTVDIPDGQKKFNTYADAVAYVEGVPYRQLDKLRQENSQLAKNKILYKHDLKSILMKIDFFKNIMSEMRSGRKIIHRNELNYTDRNFISNEFSHLFDTEYIPPLTQSLIQYCIERYRMEFNETRKRLAMARTKIKENRAIMTLYILSQK